MATISQLNRLPEFVEKITLPEGLMIRYHDMHNIQPLDIDLKDYEIIHFGWYFNQPLDFLLSYPNIKCVIFGHSFNNSLNVLEPLIKNGSLELIVVMTSYNQYITDDVYKITKSTTRSIFN